MLNFLFWNLQNKRLDETIVKITQKHRFDVLIFTEFNIEPALILKKLNRKGVFYDYAVSLGCDKVKIFTKFPRNFILAVLETNRLTIRNLKLPGLEDILVAAVHFPGKPHWDEYSQAAEASRLSDAIKKAEKEIGHSRTVLVGDLNMNPFSRGVVNANGLHAVMTRQIALQGKRTVQETDYPFFYNPMWNFFGDANNSPPGSYYYRGAGHSEYFWHLYDQVLIRPDLLTEFNTSDLKILHSDGNSSFLTARGIPNHRDFSDHLPISFKLSL